MGLNKRLFIYLTKEQLKSVGVFWLIMTLVNTFAIIVTFYMTKDWVFGPIIKSGQYLSFAGSNIFAVLIFFIIYGFVMYYESFSLAAGFGATRKNFYIQAIVSNFTVSLISGIIQIILLKLDNIATAKIGYKPMVDFGLLNMNDNTIVNILLISFIFLVFVSLGNLLGVLQYRFSYKFWIGFGIFVFVMQLFTNLLGMLFNGLGVLANAILNGGVFVGLIVIILAYSIGFILIRNVNVK